MRAEEIDMLANVEQRHWWFRARRRWLARELRRIGAPGRVLDIGAAGGGNTAMMAARGWRAVATDISPEAVSLLHAAGLNALHADARELPLPDASFDLVTAFDVLEHIHQDDQAAAEIYRVLKPGGTVLIGVPCDMSLWSLHDVAVSHVRRYERDELVKVISGAGFVVENVESWLVLMRPLAAMTKKRATENEIKPVPWALNLVLNAVMTVEHVLPVANGRGVSLMLRGRKPLAGEAQAAVSAPGRRAEGRRG
jgi:SAM-dependent methyltransferase